MSDPRDDLAADGDPAVTTRDELADVLMRADPLFPAVMARHLYEHMADAILSRWRLVPVEPPRHWPAYDTTVTCNLCGEHWPCEPYLAPSGTTILTAPDHQGTEVQGRAEWEQHRAADELTHHDQASGIYEPSRGQLFRNNHTGSVFRYAGDGEYNPVMLGDQPARGAQLTYPYTEGMAGPLRPYTNNDGCACGRTDQHGPHED